MTPADKQCAVCSKPGKLCSSCENIHYCGPACQRADWNVHKLLCRTFKDAREPSGPNMMRVIVFPVNGIKPEFKWMPIKPSNIQRPLVGNYFGLDNPFNEYLSFPLEPKTGKQLPLRITIQTRDSFMSDGSLPNRCIYHLTDCCPRQKFAGPILAYGNALSSHDGTNINSFNLDTTHLNTIKDYFTHGFFIPENEKLFMSRLN